MSKKKQKNILQKAEKIYFSNNNSSLLEYLMPYKTKYQIKDSQDNIIFNHLLAFAYAIQNRLPEAEKHCCDCLAVETTPLDCYFVLTYVHLAMREYDKVLQYSELYFETYDKMNSAEFNYAYTISHQCQVYNFIGSAHMELGNNNKAVKYFSKAIETEKENHLPYLNLVNLYINTKEYEQAKKILQKGMKSCSQIQELRLLEKSLAERPSISACMIVKNEEELLPDCLESIRDWVDEIIVVDTGSEDKTVEIAKSYGAKIYHQKWEGNFSKHRNYSLSLATSEWVFIIDADERMMVEDVPILMQTLQNKNVSIVSLNVFNVYGNREETTTFLPSVRFWRHELNLQYEGIVHNLLNLGMEHPVVRVNARLKHLGYDLSPEKMHQKYIRTKALLEKQLDENQDNAFALFNYAQLLQADRSKGQDFPLHNIELILKSALRAVEVTSPDEKKERHIHLMCLNQIAWAYFHNKEYDKSYEYAQTALSYKKDYLDPLLLIGHIFAQQKKWEKAKAGYKSYLACQRDYSPETEIDPLILSHIDDRASANYSLGLIAETEKDMPSAKLYYLKSLDANPGFIETNSRLAQIYHKENDLENAKKYYNQQLELSHTTCDTLLGLAATYWSEKNYDKAETYYKDAVALEDFNIQAKFQYAKFLITMQRNEEADKLFQAVLNLNSDIITEQKIGNIYFETGFYNKAAAYYKKIKTPSAELLNNIGNCYFKLDNYEDAEVYYNKSLQFNNAPEIAFRNIGITQIKLHKTSNGIANLQKYLQSNREDYPVSLVLADVYRKEGKYENALQQYESLLQIEPNNIQLLYALSECYLLMGHRDSAIIGFRRILTLKPDYKPAQEQINCLSKSIVSN